jgi:hypothetical protein
MRPEDEEEEFGAAGAARASPGIAGTMTWGIWAAFITVGVLFSVASLIYVYTVLNASTVDYANHELLQDYRRLREDLRTLRRRVNIIERWKNQTQLCINCTSSEVLIITAIATNGSITVYNSSSGQTFELVNYTVQLGQNVSELQATVDQLVINGSTPEESIRLEVMNLVPLAGTLPNSSFIPFGNVGFYTYVVNGGQGVFDTSNTTYVGINRPALIDVEYGLYFAANGTRPELICMLMPFLNSTIFAFPPVSANANTGVNVSNVLAPFHVGTIVGSGRAVAQPGWQLNVQCSIAMDNPYFILPSSFISFQVVTLDV